MLDFVLRTHDSAWIDSLNPQPASIHPAMPKLKDVVIVAPLRDYRLAIRKGPSPRIAAIIQDSPAGAAFYCLSLMDGTRSRETIQAEMLNRHPSVPPDDVERFLQELIGMGLVEDASAGVPVGLDSDDLARYSRNINSWAAMPSAFPSKNHVQAQLGKAKVLTLGVGGIGSNCALSLAMLGVGGLILVDDDTVELQNLNRQVLYDSSSVGRPKVEVAAERLRAVNPAVIATAVPERICSSTSIQNLIGEYDPQIVVLAADRPAEAIDRWTNEACFTAGLPYITGAVSGALGRVWSKVPGTTSCEECDRMWLSETSPDEFDMLLYRERQDVIPATSALGFGAQVVGGLIGYDILSHLLGGSMTSAGCLITVDFFKMVTTSSHRPNHPNCPVCGVVSKQPEGQGSQSG